LASDLAAVVTALRDIQVLHTAFADPHLRRYRADPIETMDETTRHNVTACRAISNLGLDLDAALRAWEEAMGLTETDTKTRPRCYHGDPLYENLPMRYGHLTAVLTSESWL
jgi:hypothetical protein